MTRRPAIGLVAALGACAGTPDVQRTAGAGVIDAAFLCGDTPVSVTFDARRADVTVGGDYPGVYHLSQTPAADGYHYETAGERGLVALRGRGEEAMLRIEGRVLPVCREAQDTRAVASASAPAADASPIDPAGIAGRTFAVEDVLGLGILDGIAVTVVFGEDGTLSGQASCNRFHGPYAIAGDGAFSTGPLSTTRMMCPEAAMAQERRILSVLREARTIRRGPGGGLVLIARDGRALTLKRGAPA